jgi:hypothetical protein
MNPDEMLLEQDSGVGASRARILEFPETDRGRGVILTGIILLLFGLLLANFGALELLRAESIEEIARNRVLRMLPAAETPITKWSIFGVTSALMAIGMVLVGSRTYHPSLLALHVVVPLSIVPMIFGYFYRASCNAFPMSAQLWAGAGAFLSATSMAWLVNAVGQHQSQMQIMLIALQFQLALALLCGSIVVFWQQIRNPASNAILRPVQPAEAA